MAVQLRVNGPRGDEKVIHLCANAEEMKEITVRQLKEKIAQEFRITSDLRVVYKTETLEESSLLLSYGIRHMSTVHTLLMLPGGV